MCLCVHVCVLGVHAGFFCLVSACVSHGKKWNRSYLPQTGPPSSGQNKLPKADPSCLPSPPLSGDFHHSAEAALCAKAPLQAHLPLYSEDRSSLCTTFLADVIHFDASCLLICLSQEKNSTCLSRLSVFSWCGGSRTASEYALLYNT